MNKKFKKILATVSAVAMCATSLVSMGVGAIATFPDKELGDKTVSFSARMVEGDVKFHLLPESADYFDGTGRIYVSDKMVNNSGEEYIKMLMSYHVQYGTKDFWDAGLLAGFYYDFGEDEDTTDFETYLSDNNISYKKYSESVIFVDYGSVNYGVDFELLQKIKEDTGRIVFGSCLENPVFIGETENELPAPTLLGDANEDGEVSLADAVFIMQVLSNPDDFQLTPQGMANADISGDGDGITVMDALRIQEIQIGL